MGGVEGAKKALDILRQKCIDAGFDGVIVMMEERSASAKDISLMKEMGVDYIYSYYEQLK
jgi:hypothetical protein